MREIEVVTAERMLHPIRCSDERWAVDIVSKRFARRWHHDRIFGESDRSDVFRRENSRSKCSYAAENGNEEGVAHGDRIDTTVDLSAATYNRPLSARHYDPIYFRYWPRACQNPNYMPCRSGSARFKSTKSREIEPTCPKMHCTISASRVLTHPRPISDGRPGYARG